MFTPYQLLWAALPTRYPDVVDFVTLSNSVHTPTVYICNEAVRWHLWCECRTRSGSSMWWPRPMCRVRRGYMARVESVEVGQVARRETERKYGFVLAEWAWLMEEGRQELGTDDH